MTKPATTRRDMLRLGTSAAAYAAGAAIATGGVALASQAKGETASTAAWDQALREYRHADAAADRHWETTEEPAWHAASAYTPDQHAKINQESDRLGTVRGDAEDHLFEVPAPHIEALAIKLDLLFGGDDGGRDPIPGFQRLVLADAKRLGGVA